MPDVTPERISTIAEAARVPIQPGAADRVATAISVPVKRLAAANIEIPLEVEPASFMAEQQREQRR